MGLRGRGRYKGYVTPRPAAGGRGGRQPAGSLARLKHMSHIPLRLILRGEWGWFKAMRTRKSLASRASEADVRQANITLLLAVSMILRGTATRSA